MTRIIVMGIVMAFAVGFVGCRACLAPYDYCQPTFIPERGDQCMGELYRCGSVLGGMNRTSNATGDCESCGGGSVEYYDAQGGAISVPQNAVETTTVSALPNPPAPPANATNVAPYYGANEAGFALNDDSAETY